MLKYSYSAIAHLQKAPITASLELVPVPDISPMGENIMIFSNETFQVLIFGKKIHITESYLSKFLENILNHEKN